jgi:Rhomboid-like protein
MFRRYAVAWCYLGAFLIVEVVYAALSPHAQAALTNWASTSVANLEHEPIGSLVVSAFVGQDDYLALPVLIVLALFGANRALGNAWTAVVCVAGQVIGSLLSEGIIAYRVDTGALPVADRHLVDVGPSYVVMSAIVIALICGTWLARAAAALDLAILIFIGDAFGGLSRLDVAAVGHLTAAVTAAAVTAVALVLIRRRSQATCPTPMPTT